MVHTDPMYAYIYMFLFNSIQINQTMTSKRYQKLSFISAG